MLPTSRSASENPTPDRPNITRTSGAVNVPSVRVTWNRATIAAMSMRGTSALAVRSSAKDARYDAWPRIWAAMMRRYVPRSATLDHQLALGAPLHVHAQAEHDRRPAGLAGHLGEAHRPGPAFHQNVQ